MKEVKAACDNGFKEIVLTGINIGSWNEDGKNLADLIIQILDETKIERLRLSSIEPQNFNENFEKLFASPKYKNRFCPHMHMSLQSGCDEILKRMRRNYSTELYKKVAKRFKELNPDIALTTDVIVGFPGETENNFEETCEFVKNIGFAKIHVFPYSKRAGTAAAIMDEQIPEDVKKTRAKKLQRMSDDLQKEFFESQIGKIYPILIEHKTSKNFVDGVTPNYVPVKIVSDKDLHNQIVNVKLDKVKDGFVEGKII
jgi:threonylcarbamoyladenosine tRNA methylthiotransferase MtaB